MPVPLAIFAMTLRQVLGPQRLERRPEPSQVTDAASHVAAYDQVMLTKLAIAYAVGLEVLHRAAPERLTQAVDLACGPGHFTIAMARHLAIEAITGYDLSAPMVETASANADQAELPATIRFLQGDATSLPEVADGAFSLATCTDAAHHMPDLQTVRAMLTEMDRVTADDGLVFVMDLARLRTASLTDRYVEVLASDYAQRGLSSFLEDFRNSMFAAWTVAELRSTAPPETRRRWVHIAPPGLPTMQFVLGLPVGRDRCFLRPGYGRQHPLLDAWAPRWRESLGDAWAHATLTETRLARLGVRSARPRSIR